MSSGVDMDKTLFCAVPIGTMFKTVVGLFNESVWEKTNPFFAKEVNHIENDLSVCNAVLVGGEFGTCATFEPLTEIEVVHE